MLILRVFLSVSDINNFAPFRHEIGYKMSFDTRSNWTYVCYRVQAYLKRSIESAKERQHLSINNSSSLNQCFKTASDIQYIHKSIQRLHRSKRPPTCIVMASAICMDVLKTFFAFSCFILLPNVCVQESYVNISNNCEPQ